MGMSCLYRCDKCGWEFWTWGPREFYRDASGNRLPYGHPLPASPEAERHGISGLDAQLFCLTCGKTHQVVLDEFPRSVHDPLSAWRPPRTPVQPNCPDCGQPRLVAALPDDQPIPCPRCGRGPLRLAGGGVA
jgi:hypothetical protein